MILTSHSGIESRASVGQFEVVLEVDGGFYLEFAGAGLAASLGVADFSVDFFEEHVELDGEAFVFLFFVG